MATANDFEVSIHQRLVSGEPTASAELFEHYQGRLVNVLRKLLWQRDESMVIDAATDALFEFIRNPGSYDPAKSPLFNYLVLAAKRDLINAVSKKVTREQSEIAMCDVEDDESGGNKIEETVDQNAPDDLRRVRIMYGREVASKLMEEMSNPTDRAILSLMVDNVRETMEYASILGITNLSASEQRKRVKLHKDRIGKQLERFGERLRGKAN